MAAVAGHQRASDRGARRTTAKATSATGTATRASAAAPDGTGRRRPPRLGQQHGQPGTQEVGAPVTQVDAGRRPVVEEEPEQGTRPGRWPAGGRSRGGCRAKPTAATAATPAASMSRPSMRLTPLITRRPRPDRHGGEDARQVDRAGDHHGHADGQLTDQAARPGGRSGRRPRPGTRAAARGTMTVGSPDGRPDDHAGEDGHPSEVGDRLRLWLQRPGPVHDAGPSGGHDDQRGGHRG